MFCHHETNNVIIIIFLRFKQNNIQPQPMDYHQHIVAIVRDYMEILLMSVLLAMLVLKKKMLQQCLLKRLKGAHYNPPDEQETRIGFDEVG